MTSVLVGEVRAEHANVAGRVTKLIAERLAVPRDRIKPDASFKALGADSLDCVELTMAAEEEFDIEVPDAIVKKVTTVGDMIRQIGAIPARPPRPEPQKK